MLTGIASLAVTLTSQIMDGIVSWAKLASDATQRIYALSLLSGD